MTGTKVGTEHVEREAGYLYYLGKDGFVWAAPMKRNKTGKKKKLTSVAVTKKAGCMYFLGKDGFVYETKLKHAKA
jgi:hypothetical protein